MAKIARRVLEYRERQSRGAVMRPSTFAAIERKAAASGAEDPRAVAGAAYWKNLAARYRGNPISEEPDPKYPGEMRFVEWRRAMLTFINSHWYGGTLSDSEFRQIARIVHMPPEAGYDWSFIRDADDKEVIEVFLLVQSRHPELGPHRGFNPSRKGSVERISERSAKVVTAKGHVDYPIRYDDGRIAYDWPERVPAHLKKQVARLLGKPRVQNSFARTYEAAGKSFSSRAKAEKYAKSIEKTSGIRVPVYETTGANPSSILDGIRHGDKVTILVPSGQHFDRVEGKIVQEYSKRTGTAVMRGPHGWVLNLGGRFGTPGIATEQNIVNVRKVNPTKAPKLRKRESVPEYHKRRVRAIVEKMPPQIRAVFDRNPSGYQFIFTNPDEDLSAAEDLYKTFHGRDPREILELTESAETRGEYTGLGDLVELTIDAPNGDRVIVAFKDDGVRLASSPEGTQLYLLGGNQDISSLLGKFGADSSKDLVDLGDLKQLVYEAAKWQTDYTPQEWKHDLGEESGIRPRTFFDQLKKKIFFAGGTYRVKRPGIVD